MPATRARWSLAGSPCDGWAVGVACISAGAQSIREWVQQGQGLPQAHAAAVRRRHRADSLLALLAAEGLAAQHGIGGQIAVTPAAELSRRAAASGQGRGSPVGVSRVSGRLRWGATSRPSSTSRRCCLGCDQSIGCGAAVVENSQSCGTGQRIGGDVNRRASGDGHWLAASLGAFRINVADLCC